MTDRPHTGADARQQAARVLYACLAQNAYPDRELEKLSAAPALTTEIAYGVLRWSRALEWIAHRLTRQLPAPRLRAHLFSGLYQLLFLDHVAVHAALNESVEAAKADAGPKGAAFINAVLRRAQREQEQLLAELAKQPLGIRWSHPDVLIERWMRVLGPERTEALCRWNNERPSVTIRIRTGGCSVADYLHRLQETGHQGKPHPAAPDQFVTLKPTGRIGGLPGFNEGLFVVQDPSTRLAVELLDPRPGETILDACAAPGGKTVYIADRMRGQGSLVAADVAPKRLDRIRENAERTGWVEFVRIVRHDLTASKKTLQGAPTDGFDGILLDVPCSNTGVLRRRADARWHFSKKRLKELVALQRALLDAAVPHLKPGGRLVYSTCSVEPEENELQIRDWLASHPQFRLIEQRQSTPPADDQDGAFSAKVAL